MGQNPDALVYWLLDELIFFSNESLMCDRELPGWSCAPAEDELVLVQVSDCSVSNLGRLGHTQCDPRCARLHHLHSGTAGSQAPVQV